MRALGLLFVAAMMAGCGGSSITPSAQVDDVGFKRASAAFVDMTVDLTVSNPMPFGLDIARSSYSLLLDGNEVASSGAAGFALHIDASGESPLSIPIEIHDADFAAATVGALVNGGTTYEIDLGLGFDTKAGPLDITASQTSTIDLSTL